VVALAIAPWGEVLVDGERKGVSPPLTRLQLAPGAHRIEIRNAGAAPVVREVTLAAGETFDRGELRLDTRIERDGGTVWLERGRLAGGDPLLDSPAGLAGFSVCATLLAAGAPVGADLLAACRSVDSVDTGAKHGITIMDDRLVARYLGHSAEAARHWLTALWALLRPALLGRPAVPPRIWNT